MHETEQDVTNQQEVADFLQATLTGKFEFVGHHIAWVKRKTTGLDTEPDYDIWWNHLRVGVVEIKCRTYKREFFDREGVIIDRPKMECLWRENKHGFKAMLVIRTGDMFVYYAMMDDLIADKELWATAPTEYMSTTNHGSDKRDKPFDGFVLPTSSFKAGGWMK